MTSSSVFHPQTAARASGSSARPVRRVLARHIVQVLVLSSLAHAGLAHASPVKFNAAFLPGGSRDLDLALYGQGNPVPPGVYRADVFLNGTLRTRQDIRIDGKADGRQPTVCMTRALLARLEVDPAQITPDLDDSTCIPLEVLVSGGHASFSLENQQLDLTAPQAALLRQARGYVSPDLWDAGVTAGMLRYTFSAHSMQTAGPRQDSASLWLEGGLNLGAWRLRHLGSMRWDSHSGHRYDALDSYAQRDLTAWRSQLTVGQATTPGDVFDALRFEGMQITSDDRMLPGSLRGFAPTVRGIARTIARVVIRQAGNLLHETTVAPGPFVIDDLYATGYGGDLDVTVVESDGGEQRYVVPYASVAQLLRPGATRYAMTAGRLRNPFLDEQPGFVQASLQRGVNNQVTAYGGVQAAEHYLSFIGGMAFATPIGALSVDLSHASAKVGGEGTDGQSLRLSYSRQLLAQGTNFSLAAYRFSTQGYFDLGAAALQHGEVWERTARPQSRLAVNVDQRLGRWGHLSFSGYAQTYWGDRGRTLQYQASYNQQFGSASVGLGASRTRSDRGVADSRLLLTVSIPLGAREDRFLPQLSAQFGRDGRGSFDQRVSLNGTAGEDRAYAYGASLARAAGGRVDAMVNGQWTGSRTSLNATLAGNGDYRSASFGASGSLVAHRSGLTLSPFQGDTLAVIRAPGAAGARVAGYPGLRLDRAGNAVVPYLRPYEMNEVAIDPTGLPLDVELRETSQQIAPRAGAVVVLDFATHSGRPVVFQVQQADGRDVPFGSTVVDSDGLPVGAVGQGGQLYARVQDNARRLQVQWGERAGQRCQVTLPAVDNSGRQVLACGPVGAQTARETPDAGSRSGVQAGAMGALPE